MRSFFLAASAGLILQCAAQSPWHQAGMCVSSGCNDCPVSFENAGPGYPICNVYEASDHDGTYGSADQGGVEVWMDIDQPDANCAFIVRSPAGNDQEGCGQNILTARNAICTRVVLRGTFMTQFCCGFDDCNGAGAGLPGRRSVSSLGGGPGAGLIMVDSNGQVIPPLSSGSPPKSVARSDGSLSLRRSGGATIAKPQLEKRDCTFNPTGDVYTRTGETQPIYVGVTGPASYSESESVSVGFSTSVEAGLNLEIFSAGVSFETSTETSRSTSITIEVPEDVTGAVVWTATLQCQDGYLSGSGCSGEGWGCVPAVDGQGRFVGTTAFQIRA